MTNKLILEDNLKGEVVELAPHLKVMDGGKGGNWLVNLKVGTEFLCQMRKANPLSPEAFVYLQFKVQAKTEKSILLVTDVNQETMQFVNPTRFCNMFDWVETLREGEDDI